MWKATATLPSYSKMGIYEPFMIVTFANKIAVDAGNCSVRGRNSAPGFCTDLRVFFFLFYLYMSVSGILQSFCAVLRVLGG